jgi:hypothetical protein
MFADDTTAVSRESGQEARERLLVHTLKEWGETVKPSKTKRLAVRPEREGDADKYQEAVTLVGGWLQWDGGHFKDMEKRLEAASKLLHKLHKMLPKFGLGEKQVGTLIKATIVRCLLYGMKARAVSGREERRLQVFLNKVIKGITRQRIKNVHDDQVMIDLSRWVGIQSVHVMIGKAQLSI